MCGIAGILNSDPSAIVSLDELEQMCAVIKHRGPDDQGIYCEGQMGLGSRRLSIIDLVTGHMPIHNEDKTVWVVFNGEIYNFRSLRSDLEGRGHRFYTNTDTEVLVHLYEEYGVNFPKRLRGMFGIALWDSKSQQLILVRDRLGIKPLYYRVEAGRVLFASELKSLLQVTSPKPAVNLTAVNHYLSLGYIPDPYTIFEGVSRLAPGHLIVCRGGKAECHKYWELPWPQETNVPDEDECCERLRVLLTEAVKMRLVSDVPLGAFLSGGIDSSTIVGLMSRLSDRPVKTFSIGFAEADFSELGHARYVAQHYGTEHHELVVNPQAVQLAERLATHFDEPIGDPSAIPTYLVSQLARESVTVALSGDGGDELFAGYSRYREARRQRVWDWVPSSLRQGILLPLSRRMPSSAYGKRYLHRAALPDGLARYFECSVLPYSIKEQLVSKEFADQVGSLQSTKELCRNLSNGRKHALLEQLLYLDATTELPADILTKVDRMSMAHSLEVRVPLLDHVFVEYAARLPMRYKLRGQTMKYCFKKAFGPLLPDGILRRRKTGFGVPLRHWFAHDLRDFVRDVLFDSRAMQRGYFRADYLETLVREHSTGRRNHGYLLWSLMAFELWHRQAGL
jgi:asparagine synthase (glutamine-hydrolysing)